LVEEKTRMQHGFGERIDLLLQKSVRAASRLVKERQKEAREKGMGQEPPSFEEFSSLVNELMENGKRVDLDRLRNLSLKELFEQTWSQKVRNYAIQRQIKDAYDALVRRSKRDS
jgi:phosphate uptake regulator